ncbi:ras-related protein Rab-9A isoform X1 [Polypterus senegalus]
MPDTKEIANLAYSIEKQLVENNPNNILLLLEDLETAHLTLAQLQETNIVKALYHVLRTCTDVPLKRKAKSLLSKWKKLFNNTLHQISYQNEKNFCVKGNGMQDTHTNTVEKSSNSGSRDIIHNIGSSVCSLVHHHDEVCFTSEQRCFHPEKMLCTGVKDEENKQPVENILKDSVVSTSHHIELMSQAIIPAEALPTINDVPTMKYENSLLRSKCAELIFQAITSEEADVTNIQEMSIKIEQNIFNLHGNNDKKYKACIRSKIANLKNPRTPHLRQNLLCGQLSPKSFAEMSVDEMACDKLKQLRATYTKHGINEHQIPQGVEGTRTNKVKCRRCENFDCSVTVINRGTLFLPSWVKTGNPDEQMMTFVTCNKCGEKWYNNGWICL